MGSPQPPLGELELEVLKVIWDLQPCTVKQIAEVLAQRSGHARTTVLTVMQRLHAKGFLKRSRKEGLWRYSSTHDRQRILSHLVSQFMDTVLDSSPAPLRGLPGAEGQPHRRAAKGPAVDRPQLREDLRRQPDMNAFLQLVDGLGTSWAEVMGRALWQSAVLAAAIYGLTCCLRRQPATMRYWLWMLVPLRLLVMPLITLPLPVLPAANDPPIPVTLAPVGSVSPVAEDRWNTPEPIASLAASRTTIPSLDVPDRADARSPATPTSVSWSAPSLVASLLGLWAAGALFFAVRLTRGWMATRRFIRASVAITDPSILAMARQVAQTIGVTPLPRLARTRLDISPLVCGLRQPVIVLPEAAVHASPEELRAILAQRDGTPAEARPAGWLAAGDLRTGILLPPGVSPGSQADPAGTRDRLR